MKKDKKNFINLNKCFYATFRL